MDLNRFTTWCRHFVRNHNIIQMAFIIVLWKVGDIIAYLTHLPVPGSVIGMVILLILLKIKFVRLSSVKKGAGFFLAMMLLFFVPAVLAILNHPEFIGWTGLKILLVIFVGTAVVMTCTALTIELYFRFKARNNKGDDHAVE